MSNGTFVLRRNHTDDARVNYAKADPTGVLHTFPPAWEPDPKFNQTNSDITLMMLAQNDLAYLKPSDDPWMTAQVVQDIGNSTMWSKDYEVSILGCVDQYQVCNPNKPGDSGCTTLGGLMSTENQALATKYKSLGFNEPQLWTITRFVTSATDKGMGSNVDGRGGAALNGKI